MLEEQQIQDFVHRVALDQRASLAVAGDPPGMSIPRDVSPRVAEILARLLPYLAYEQAVDPHEKWWHA